MPFVGRMTYPLCLSAQRASGARPVEKTSATEEPTARAPEPAANEPSPLEAVLGVQVRRGPGRPRGSAR
jgi:hypothetical protein